MTDGIIKGTGNSRYLKSVSNFLMQYPTYEKFAQALIAGTLPIDVNGINANGWNQQGTPMTKTTFLKDSTAALFGKTGGNNPSVPDDVFVRIRDIFDSLPTISKIAMVETGSVTLASTGSSLPGIKLTGTHKAGILFSINNAGSYDLIVISGATGLWLYTTERSQSVSCREVTASFSSSTKTLSITASKSFTYGTYYYLEFTTK